MSLGRRGLLLGVGAAVVAAGCGSARPAARRAPRLQPDPGPTKLRPTQAPDPTPTAHVPSGPAREITSGARSSKQVALTFHVAGDPHVVGAVLDAADRANAHLTMLVVGEWLAQNPHFAHRILAGGHDLGNHTWSHPVLPSDDAAMTRLEIMKCRDVLTRLTGSGGRWFRPSGTPQATPLILKAAGHAGYPTSLSYDVDPLDYTNPGADAVVSRVLSAAHGGAIVSLHTLYAGTADALPRIIAGLRGNGLQPVAASRLLPHAHQGLTA